MNNKEVSPVTVVGTPPSEAEENMRAYLLSSREPNKASVLLTNVRFETLKGHDPDKPLKGYATIHTIDHGISFDASDLQIGSCQRYGEKMDAWPLLDTINIPLPYDPMDKLHEDWIDFVRKSFDPEQQKSQEGKHKEHWDSLPMDFKMQLLRGQSYRAADMLVANLRDTNFSQAYKQRRELIDKVTKGTARRNQVIGQALFIFDLSYWLSVGFGSMLTDWFNNKRWWCGIHGVNPRAVNRWSLSANSNAKLFSGASVEVRDTRYKIKKLALVVKELK